MQISGPGKTSRASERGFALLDSLLALAILVTAVVVALVALTALGRFALTVSDRVESAIAQQNESVKVIILAKE